MDTLAKMSQNMFAYFSISEHSPSFYLFFFRKKHLFWLRNPYFFYAFPLSTGNTDIRRLTFPIWLRGYYQCNSFKYLSTDFFKFNQFFHLNMARHIRTCTQRMMSFNWFKRKGYVSLNKVNIITLHIHMYIYLALQTQNYIN